MSADLQAKQTARLSVFLMFLWISVMSTLGQTVDSAARARQNVLHLKTTLSLQGKPKAIDLSPDGKTLAISVDDAVQLWDLSNGKLVRAINGFQRNSVISWSPDSTRLLMTHWGSQSALWTREHPSDEVGFPNFKHLVCVELWSPDSKHLVTADAKDTLVVWNADNRTRRFELKLKKKSNGLPVEP